ncbi:hypothetical protein B0H10DRAFT_1954243 [Mycena sp. CBHHK59/15]|nr:hypothetical protein B0H10DRAFT_1954243 [Mycena sp. CBHHK59/15]
MCTGRSGIGPGVDDDEAPGYATDEGIGKDTPALNGWCSESQARWERLRLQCAWIRGWCPLEDASDMGTGIVTLVVVVGRVGAAVDVEERYNVGDTCMAAAGLLQLEVDIEAMEEDAEDVSGRVKMYIRWKENAPWKHKNWDGVCGGSGATGVALVPFDEHGLRMAEL